MLDLARKRSIKEWNLPRLKRRALLLGLSALVSTCLTACAIPPSGYDQQTFVPEMDLRVVSLVREGLYYLRESRFVDAEFKFRQALFLYPTPQNVRLDLALALEMTGNYDEAIKVYQTLLDENPQSITFLAGIGHAYASAQRLDEARSAYARAIRLAIDNNEPVRAANAARSIATISFQAGDVEEAFCYSQLAYLLNPSREELLRHSGILLARDMSQEALTVLQAFRTANPAGPDAELLHQLALATLGLRKFEEGAHLEELSQDAIKDKSGIATEAQVVMILANRLAGKTEPGNAERPLVELKDLEYLNTVQWPSVLVDALAAYITELEAAEG